MRTQSLLRNAVAMGVERCDTDEGAVEVMALSHRDRRLVVETVLNLSDLQPSDDNTRAREIVAEALRRGDEGGFWWEATLTDGRREARSAAGNRPRADESATSRPNETAGIGPVAAHRLLNSSAVVSMGISTLLRLWDSLPAEQRTHLLSHMATHAATVDDCLKLLSRGLDAEAASVPPGATAPHDGHERRTPPS